MQRQVEELDVLRVEHYQDIMEHEEEVWDFVQSKVWLYHKRATALILTMAQVSVVVRSTLDVFDRFTAKA